MTRAQFVIYSPLAILGDILDDHFPLDGQQWRLEKS